MSHAAVMTTAPPFSLTSKVPVSVSSATLDELLSRISSGDRDAFSDLYDSLAPLVFGLAMRTIKSRLLAEEVTQEVFIQVWRQSDRFDQAKGSARSWVATLAHRRAVDTVRRTQASTDRESSVPVERPRDDVADNVVDEQIEVDNKGRVRAALAGLTDLQREAIELAYFNGLTYREVAERLDAPLGTVKSRMRDGLARMRSIMEQGDE